MYNGKIGKSKAYDIKVSFIGDTSVGKTTIVNKLLGSNGDSTGPTIGSKCDFKIIKHENNTSIRLSLWDTAGQERFRSICPQYLRNSHIVIVVFDVNSEKSFRNILDWVKDARDATEIYDLIIIGNKSDLEQRKISLSDGNYWAQQLNAIYFDMSAFNPIDINKLWDYIVKTSKDISKTRNIPQMELNVKESKNSCCYG